ncbi:MAG: efflux RND transporter periplasmic adaptor subunit [Aestuariibaculum sp.]
MQKSRYFILILMLILFNTVSCGDKKHDSHAGHDHAEENTHEHTEGDNHNHEEEEEHDHGEEGYDEAVMLTFKQFDALKMNVEALATRNMGGYVETNGSLEVPPQNEAAITAVIGANVVSINVIEGDKVNKGQVVAYLSHPDLVKLQTDYLDALSNSNFLKKDYERQKKLYDAGVGSGANFQKSEAEYEASKAKVNGLAAQLRILNISPALVQKGTIVQRVALQSPIEGFVQKVEVKTGQYVEPQTDLFEIVNTDHVHADFMVFEKDVHKIKKGQTVLFSVQSASNQEYTAEIYSVGKTFEEAPKAVHVHAEIKNKTGYLIPGMYIQGRILVANDSKTAIPESAIVTEGDKSYIFTAKKEENGWGFKPVEVFVGHKDGDWVEINLKDQQPENTLFAYNNAYYLIAEMKKSEAGHSH